MYVYKHTHTQHYLSPHSNFLPNLQSHISKLGYIVNTYLLCGFRFTLNISICIKYQFHTVFLGADMK